MRVVPVVLLCMAIGGCKARRASVAALPSTTATVFRPAVAERTGNSATSATKPASAQPVQEQPTRRARPVSLLGARPERAASPELELMRTREEADEILLSIRESVSRAEANLAALRSRQLSGEYSRALGRIDNFLRQARSAQKANDLPTARQYAKRAELLSTDLLKR